MSSTEFPRFSGVCSASARQPEESAERPPQGGERPKVLPFLEDMLRASVEEMRAQFGNAPVGGTPETSPRQIRPLASRRVRMAPPSRQPLSHDLAPSQEWNETFDKIVREPTPPSEERLRSIVTNALQLLDTAVRHSANISFKDKEPMLTVARDKINGAIADPTIPADQKLKILHVVMTVGLRKT